jgi:hypothetical protein
MTHTVQHLLLAQNLALNNCSLVVAQKQLTTSFLDFKVLLTNKTQTKTSQTPCITRTQKHNKI